MPFGPDGCSRTISRIPGALSHMVQGTPCPQLCRLCRTKGKGPGGASLPAMGNLEVVPGSETAFVAELVIGIIPINSIDYTFTN